MRIFLTLGLTLSLSINLCGQTSSKPEQDDVIRTNTNLIQVRAVVTDRAGKLVDNLKQDDFEVFENGKPQQVSVFSLERIRNNQNSASSPEPANDSNSANANATRVPPSPSRTMVLFVDTLHLSSISLIRAKQQLKRFVDEQITDQDLVGIVTTSDSLGLLGQFMRDRKLLKHAIDKISLFTRTNTLFTPYLAARVLSENPFVPQQQQPLSTGRQGVRNPMPSSDPSIPGLQAMAVAQAIMTGEDGVAPNEDMVRARAREVLGQESIMRKATLKILKGAGERMATLPGQRLIAFVSDGFTLRDDNGSSDNNDFSAATSRAVRAGVVIYAFYPLGLTTPVEYTAASPVHLDSSNPTLGIAFGSYMADSRTESQSTLRELAAETGGEASLNSNDVVGQFKKMLNANDVYYAMGYYFHDESDHKFRSLRVRVKNHPEYHVRTQRGYQLSSERANEVAATPQKKLFQAMMAPLPLMNIAVTSSANFLARADDEAKVTLDVHFDGRSVQFEQTDQKYRLNCEIAVAILDERGKISEGVAEGVAGTFDSGQIEKAKRDGFRYTKRIALSPGLYQLRIGVRDVHSGLMGTSNAWVNVPNLAIKKPVLSDLFLGRQDRNNQRTESVTLNDDSTTTARMLIGPASFTSGDIIFYRAVLYNSALVSKSDANALLKVEVLNSSEVVYDGHWQPLNGKIIRKDSVGIELGGEVRMASEPGVYTLRITIKDANGVVQRTKEFELLK